MGKLSIRKWLSFIVAGIVGQLAWAIENNYLNLFVHECEGSYTYIPIMTAASAVAATLTTLLMGALSDRLGKRKVFIGAGYIIWGFSIILFAFLNPYGKFSIVGSSTTMAGAMIVVMDCVMTFFGSTANDAAFNAYVTDNTTTENRGKVESVLSVLPLIALVLVLLSTMILKGGTAMAGGTTSSTDWTAFFVIFGILTTVAGVVSLFLLPKDSAKPNKSEPYIKNIFYGFRPSVVKSNKMLYIVLLAFMIFNIALQTFLPYYMVYIQTLFADNWIIVLGVVLVLAMAITVVFGLFMDRIGKNRILIPSVIVAIVGAVIMSFLKEANLALVLVGGTILMTGYLVGTAVLGAKVRDYTPASGVGLFQGVRMLFCVLIPMCSGPFIGLAICGNTFSDYWSSSVTANNFIFLGAAIIFVVGLIPLVWLLIRERKERKNA